MIHPRRDGPCQGNFAASVKKILPINEGGVLALATLAEHYLAKIPRIGGDDSLTGCAAVA
jgi:hypothetical protein